MYHLPAAHPDRFVLAEEVHARPPTAFHIPGMASYVAVLVDSNEREAEHQHIANLCQHFGVSPPPPNSTHLTTQIAGMTMKWERHGEFSSLTFMLPQSGIESVNFAVSPLEQLPPNWLNKMPGQTIAAVLACVRHAVDDRWGPAAASFEQSAVVGCNILQGRATVLTDFKLHPDACTRFVLLDHGLSARQAGQTLQRLFEIEAYRMLALLALPIARRLSPRILAIERSLSSLTDGIAQEGGDDERLLNELTRLAAEIESGLASSQFRFGACRAYYALVTNRIRELNEERLMGIPTFAEFMARRFDPAVSTCNTVSQRLIDISERVAQASGLLSTRVEIARERQNQRLLSSMDSRAKMQLRLQQTVEGLSIAAIVYYLAGLVGYAAKALKSAGAPINADVMTGLAIPILGVLVYSGIRRARSRLVEYDEPHSERRVGKK